MIFFLSLAINYEYPNTYEFYIFRIDQVCKRVIKVVYKNISKAKEYKMKILVKFDSSIGVEAV